MLTNLPVAVPHDKTRYPAFIEFTLIGILLRANEAAS